MLEGFVRQCFEKHRSKGDTRPERCLDVDLVIAEETGSEPAISGQANAVAARAIGVTHRRYNADCPWRSIEAVVFRRSIASCWSRIWRHRADEAHAVQNLIRWHDVIERQCGHLTDRHQLDESNIPCMIESQPGEIF